MGEEIKLGSCCACGREDETCKHLIMLNIKAPMPGTGWGCMVCGLPMDGALVVLCDRCLEADRQPVWVVYGMVAFGERVLLSTCSGEFSHRLDLHPEARG